MTQGAWSVQLGLHAMCGIGISFVVLALHMLVKPSQVHPSVCKQLNWGL